MAAVFLGLLGSPAAAQQPIPGSPTAIDGPSPDIARPSGLALSVARDGSGGLVYLKQTGGANHVFFSALVGGAFQAPVQIDSGLAGASSQPVIAAGNGGLLLIAFVNSGELYVVGRPSQAAALSAPAGLAGGGYNPAISMTNLGKAYLAFTIPDGAGNDVRTAYYYNGAWALEGPPLNATPADNAGTGLGRPEVAAAGDGVAIVVWGENGHVYARRVWATTPSLIYQQADAPPAGCSEVSADEPVVGAGGDSSYAPVAFRERVSCSGPELYRVFTNRLHASTFDGITAADGVSGPPDNAQDPQETVTEYGQGWVTSEQTVSDGVFAQELYGDSSPGSASQVNSLPITSAPDPVPAAAGLYSTFIAWQQQPGTTAPSEIRVRYAPDGVTLGPEMVVSSPAQGPIDAADGIAAGGDVYGEAAVAWLQGAAGASTVMVEQMYQNPGPFLPAKMPRYATTSQPVFSWSRPHGWGPMKYSLVVDGAVVNQTYASSVAPAAPLPDGPHSWQVFAANPAGQASKTKVGGVFIDTVSPRVRLRFRNPAVLDTTFRATLTYTDAPPAGEPPRDASGVAKVVIRWGDGTTTRIKLGTHQISHTYRRAGRYRLTILVSDRAGNLTRLLSRLRVVKSAPKGKHATTTVTAIAPAPPPPPTSSGPPPNGGVARHRTKR